MSAANSAPSFSGTDRTWSYLRGESGAAVRAHRDPGGHGLSPSALAGLETRLAERFTTDGFPG